MQSLRILLFLVKADFHLNLVTSTSPQMCGAHNLSATLHPLLVWVRRKPVASYNCSLTDPRNPSLHSSSGSFGHFDNLSFLDTLFTEDQQPQPITSSNILQIFIAHCKFSMHIAHLHCTNFPFTKLGRCCHNYQPVRQAVTTMKTLSPLRHRCHQSELAFPRLMLLSQISLTLTSGF